MKFLTLFLLFFSINLFPQSSGIQKSEPVTKYNSHDYKSGFEILQKEVSRELNIILNQSNTTPSVLSGRISQAGYVSRNASSEDVKKFMLAHKDLFGLNDPYSELKEISSVTDELQMTHIKFNQYFNGLKIFPSELVFHINSDGSIESMNGNYLPTPDMNPSAELTSAEAVNTALRQLGEYDASAQSAELILYRKNNTLTPAYEVKLPSKDYPKMVLYINAENGSVIYRDNGLRFDGPAMGSGTGLTGVNRSIGTYQYGGVYYLADASLPMFVPPFDSLKGVIATYDANNSTTGNGYEEAYLVFDPNGDNNFNDNMRLRAAVDAHYYTLQVYNFYRNYFNRNSYDGLGSTLTNVVHFNVNYNNAFWNGVVLTYGDGDGQIFSNLAGALDVICHEITHGVISSSADLLYQGQSGALNESYADVMASMLDSTDWLIGEDVFTPGISGDALRSMQDPHNGQPAGGNFWQPAHMSEYQVLPETEEGDWGGVHINSGIPNKAFYNAASVIGRYKAGRIWYRALVFYLTANSQFRDMRITALLSAADLYGSGSAEYNAVQSAFDNVGIQVNTPTYYNLSYDDGEPALGVYENLAGWKLAVRFSAPSPSYNVDGVSIYLDGDANSGSGRFTLELFDKNNSGLPGNSLITPYTYTPANPFGWQEFWVTGLTMTTDLFVSMLYDGVNFARLGADTQGNNRGYEFNGSSWYQLTGADNYTLFMRAKVSTIVMDAEVETSVPEKFEVTDSYPNPFNPSTTIKYSLPEAQHVTAIVYDINGAKVAELANNFHNAGTYTIRWNGKNDSGVQVSSGIYYCRIEAGKYSAVRKMMMVK